MYEITIIAAIIFTIPIIIYIVKIIDINIVNRILKKFKNDR